MNGDVYFPRSGGLKQNKNNIQYWSEESEGFNQKFVNINGAKTTLVVDPDALLVDVLRGQLHLTGTKVGCGKAQCGACSVIMNGKVIMSCATRMKRVPDEAIITTIEGIGAPDNLHALQLAWVKHGAAQCGFCTPGFIVSAKVLLDENPNPTREEVRDWFQKHKTSAAARVTFPLWTP